MIRSQRSAELGPYRIPEQRIRALAAAVVVKEFIDANVEWKSSSARWSCSKGSTEGAATEFEYVRERPAAPGLSCSRRRTLTPA